MTRPGIIAAAFALVLLLVLASAVSAEGGDDAGPETSHAGGHDEPREPDHGGGEGAHGQGKREKGDASSSHGAANHIESQGPAGPREERNDRHAGRHAEPRSEPPVPSPDSPPSTVAQGTLPDPFAGGAPPPPKAPPGGGTPGSPPASDPPAADPPSPAPPGGAGGGGGGAAAQVTERLLPDPRPAAQAPNERRSQAAADALTRILGAGSSDAGEGGPAPGLGSSGVRAIPIPWGFPVVLLGVLFVAVFALRGGSAMVHRASAVTTGLAGRLRRVLGRLPGSAASPPDPLGSAFAAVRADPSKNAKFRLGVALANAGRLDDALEWLLEGVRLHSKDLDARYALGVALLRAGRFTEAEAHLGYAFRRNPAYLGMFVGDPHTKGYRTTAEVETFVRKQFSQMMEKWYRGYQ